MVLSVQCQEDRMGLFTLAAIFLGSYLAHYGVRMVR